MTHGIWTAAAGAINQATSLDIQANNIANGTTPGFRADGLVFRQYLAKAGGTNTASQSYQYAATRSTAPDFSVGQIKVTGNPLDVAITDRDSFFVVQTPAGERLTRSGDFRVTAQGDLLSRDGHPVLGVNHKPIKAQGPGELEISKSGDVLLGGERRGRLLFATMQDPRVLEKEGQTLLRLGPNAPTPVFTRVPTLETRALELSNKATVQGMSGMATAAREFEFATKVIEAFSSIDEKAASQIGRK